MMRARFDPPVEHQVRRDLIHGLTAGDPPSLIIYLAVIRLNNKNFRHPP
jgi:hypothetical protein